MPNTRRRPRKYSDSVAGLILRTHRWNYCQKIAQLLHRSARTDADIKAMYENEWRKYGGKNSTN